MERIAGASLIFCFLLISCGPSGFHDAISSVSVQPQSTYVPPTPQKSLAGSHEYYEGLLQVSHLNLSIDGNTRQGQLQGSFSLRPQDGSATLNVQFLLQGVIGESYTAVLRPTDATSFTAQELEVGAKLTCLYTDCSDSFVDIYIKHKGVIYHHQVEAEGNKSLSGASPSAPAKTIDPQVTSPEDNEEDVETETETETEDHTHDTRSNGYYVGTRESDIDEIFPKSEKSASAPQTPAPKDTPKKEQPQPVKPIPPRAPVKHDTSVPNSSMAAPTYSGQAIGKPFKGSLVQGVDLLAYTESNPAAGFHFLYPSIPTHFGTSSMLEMLSQLGRFTLKYLNGYVLAVNTVSAKNGGFLRGHQSHQTGLDADIGYLFKNKDLQEKFTPAVVSGKPRTEWMVEDQWKVFKFAVKTGNVDRIFVDGSLKNSLCEFATKNGELSSETDSEAFQTLRRLSPEPSHANHFHMRVRQDCPEREARCFQMVPPPNVTSCK